MNLKTFKKNAAYFDSIKWGAYSIFINFFKQILLVPVFLLTVGKDDYSFWLIISTIVLLIRALNLGQLNYTSNLININFHSKSNINEELNLGQGSNIIFVGLQILIGVALSVPLILAGVSEVSIDYVNTAYGSWSLVLLVVSRVIYQYCSLYILRLFEPLGKINTTIRLQTVGELVDFIVTVIVVYFTGSIILTCVAIFASNLLFSYYIYNYVKRNVPFDIPFLKGVQFSKSYELIKKSGLLTVSFLIEKIYEIGLNIVVVKVYAANVLPSFTTNRVMSNSALRVSNAMAVPLLPNLQKQFALENKKNILGSMKLFWRVSTSLLILSITLVLPFLETLFNMWTGHTISFDITLVGFLFIAISYQNYSMIIAEFLKKTNFSKEILIYNILRVFVTIASMILLKNVKLINGLGLSLFLGEIVGLVFLIWVMRFTFKEVAWLENAMVSLIPVVLFSLTLFLYMTTKSYLWVFGINIVTVALMNFNFFTLKRND